MKYKQWIIKFKEYEITIQEKGLLPCKWDEEKDHWTYLVKCLNKATKKHTSYFFYDSVHNTHIIQKKPNTYGNNNHIDSLYCWNKKVKEIRGSVPYSVLTSIGMDIHRDFEDKLDFFSEFGYEPSKKSERTYNRCKEAAEKLQTVFKIEDTEKLHEDELEEELKKMKVRFSNVK